MAVPCKRLKVRLWLRWQVGSTSRTHSSDGPASAAAVGGQRLSSQSGPLTAGRGTRQPECEPMGCALLPLVEGWLSVGQEG